MYVLYEYKGNLLIKADYFAGTCTIVDEDEKELPYKTLFYEYE